MEDALQELAERQAGVEKALTQERTARLNAEADLQSLRAQVTQTGVSPTVDHTASAASVATAVVASRTEPWDSRAFSKSVGADCRHDWAAVLQSHISNANADMHAVMLQIEGKTAVTHQRCRDQPWLRREEQFSALDTRNACGRTCPRHHFERWSGRRL